MRYGREYTLREVAEAVGGSVEGDPETRVRGMAGLDDAEPGAVIRVEHAKYREAALASPAAAFLTNEDLELGDKPVIRVKQVKAAFARCLELFYPEERPAPGIHPTAVIDETAVLGEGVSAGPYVVVGKGARIGRNVVLHAHAVVGENTRVGDDCVLYSHVVLYPRVVLGDRVRIHSGSVIGADGFGYIWDGQAHRKIPQVGGVRIGDDVEIGANSTIDCGTTSDTVIGAGTKIDNLVQVGHNVTTGPHCLFIAHVGIGGSVEIGRGVVLAGEAGVSDHLRLGDGAVVGALSGVWKDLPAGAQVSGIPARPHRLTLRIQSAITKLPQFVKRLTAVERHLGLKPPPETEEEESGLDG